jgi:hypothetical protein
VANESYATSRTGCFADVWLAAGSEFQKAITETADLRDRIRQITIDRRDNLPQIFIEQAGPATAHGGDAPLALAFESFVGRDQAAQHVCHLLALGHLTRAPLEKRMPVNIAPLDGGLVRLPSARLRTWMVSGHIG